jgi:hypothetical protein
MAGNLDWASCPFVEGALPHRQISVPAMAVTAAAPATLLARTGWAGVGVDIGSTQLSALICGHAGNG